MKTMTRNAIDAIAKGLSTPMPAGLRHADDTRPGYTRKKLRNAFVYFDLDGKRIDDESQIARINALAIPPAYTDVWICPDPRGHIQATGRDARGRKQYRYHPQWRETRDADKFGRMAAFGHALPKIRARVARDLARDGMPREKVIAAVVHLLDTTLIRIGSVEYARDNQSYGLTTLRKKHVKIRAGEVRFRFAGKSGIEHDVSVDDARVKRIVRKCAELPGHDLFQYIDDDGARHTIGSADINAYLRDISSADFSAKDYRTWAGSVYAMAALRQLVCESAADTRRHVVATVKEVAMLLRNTPAVCKRCYIHPEVIAAFEAGELQSLLPQRTKRHMKVDEAAFAALLAQLEKRARLARRGARKGGKTSASVDVESARLATLLTRSSALRKRANARRRADPTA
ncbi:DNA topoisomerase IB [Paraburkholderia sp. XV]|uniref:DNA topoisomerase IB n=1 Tax=Paraburkholderia sp. XV TaxID=2831520 RepID=UPI001CD77C46|nr:DNA topoisomerase IB [Paraburkholderia sp. XV]